MCEHRRLELRGDTPVVSCADCGQPVGVNVAERGPAARLVIYDEEIR